MNIKSCFLAAASTVGMLALAQPASAVIFDWTFTNEDGNIGNATDVVEGFVEFNDADVAGGPFPVEAIAIEITRVTVNGVELTETSSPFFGDGAIELDTDFIGLASVNSWTFSGGDTVTNVDFFTTVTNDTGGAGEFFQFDSSGNTLFRNDDSGSILQLIDNGSPSLEFTLRATAVPFEFSPGMGLVLAGGFLAGSRMLKQRKNNNFTK